MEKFDVYNKKREKKGYTKERGAFLNDDEFNQGAEVWIINNKKLLITKRSKNKSHAGKWEVPGGSSIINETSIETIMREIKEEIGITVKEKDLFLINTSLYKQQFVDIYLLTSKITTTKIKLQQDEVDNFLWVSKKEFLQMQQNKEIVNAVFHRFLLIEKKIEKYY